MAAEVDRSFPPPAGHGGVFSQYVVVCLLALFIVIALVAMFSTAGENGEMEWIGMTARSLDAETAAALGIPSDAGGVMVGEVEGIAREAGIRHGDVLVGIGGEHVRDMVDFARLAGKTNLPRRGARLDIIRQGVRMPVLVLPPAPGPRPARPGLAAPGGALPRRTVRAPVVIDRLWLGIDAETFTAGEGRDLGIPAGVAGVLIDAVARGSPAEQAGLAANDVIVSVDGRKIDQAADLWDTMAALNGGGRVEFGVYRRGRLASVVLPQALGTRAGGFPGRMGGWRLGPDGVPFCPNVPGTFAGGLQAAGAAGQLAAPAWSRRGRMGGWGLGPGGFLVCPGCGTRVTHQLGVPSFTVPCPSCGTLMMRAQ